MCDAKALKAIVDSCLCQLNDQLVEHLSNVWKKRLNDNKKLIGIIDEESWNRQVLMATKKATIAVMNETSLRNDVGRIIDKTYKDLLNGEFH